MRKPKPIIKKGTNMSESYNNKRDKSMWAKKVGGGKKDKGYVSRLGEKYKKKKKEGLQSGYKGRDMGGVKKACDKALYAMSSCEIEDFFAGVYGEYIAAVKKHPEYGRTVLHEDASLPWVQKNLRNARDLIVDDPTADRIVNCEWLESLEEYKKALQGKSKDEVDEHLDKYRVEVYQTIATMIRCYQLAEREIKAVKRRFCK